MDRTRVPAARKATQEELDEDKRRYLQAKASPLQQQADEGAEAATAPQPLLEPGRSVRDEFNVVWYRRSTDKAYRLEVEDETEMLGVAEAMVAGGAASHAYGERVRTEVVSEWFDDLSERETTTITKSRHGDWFIREIEASEVPSPAGES